MRQRKLPRLPEAEERMTRKYALLIVFLLVLIVPGSGRSESKWVISSGPAPLPKNSMVSLAVEISRDADTIHIDAVLNKDDEVLVLGDPILNDITNVAEYFPEKIRDDGNFYVFDFTSAEMRQLSLIITADGLKEQADTMTYPLPRFQIPSLQEVLAFVRLQEKSLGRTISVVVEMKKNWLHQGNGKDLTGSVLEVLKLYGYTTPESGGYLSSYDPEELQRIQDERFVTTGMQLKLIQLITDNDSSEHMTPARGGFLSYNYDWMFTRFGLKRVSAYADIIGLDSSLLDGQSKVLILSSYLADAHLLGLQIIAYPLEFSAVSPASDGDSVLEHYLFEINLDGLLTSQGAVVRSYLKKRSEQSAVSPQQQSIDRLIKNAEKNSLNGNPLLPQYNLLQ